MSPFSLAWPDGPHEFQVWAQILLTWSFANYGAGSDPVGQQEIASITPSEGRRWRRSIRWRAVGVAVAIAILPGPHWSDLGARLLLGLLGGGMLLLLALGRPFLTGSPGLRGYGAVWEVLINAAFVCGSAVVVAGLHLQVRPLFVLPVPAARVAAASILLASILFSLRGGTHVIRSMLDKAQTLPLAMDNSPADSASAVAVARPAVDVSEYNRGRTIGNLERLLMIILIQVGSYEALGLLVAAKGLIRARELENRDFAEYFLIGSLASVTVALVVGIPVSALVSFLWNL